MAKTGFALLTIALAAVAGCIQPEDVPQDDAPMPPSSAQSEAGPECTPPDIQASSGPGGQASVANYPGSFSYSGQTTAQTGQEIYVWENPSSGALVSWGGQSATGELKLTIQDDCGKEVYSMTTGAMSQGGASEETQRGQGGNWYLTLDFTLFTGQMGLSVNSA